MATAMPAAGSDAGIRGKVLGHPSLTPGRLPVPWLFTLGRVIERGGDPFRHDDPWCGTRRFKSSRPTSGPKSGLIDRPKKLANRRIIDAFFVRPSALTTSRASPLLARRLPKHLAMSEVWPGDTSRVYPGDARERRFDTLASPVEASNGASIRNAITGLRRLRAT